ncbi:MAG TPA: Mpo1-like protein [Burkholderiales bacterium]|nr:Mpo1-like protein [Burkholderiales bacterium]
MDSVKTLNYSVFVTRLEDGMGFYAAYHQDARNKATHFVGVPLIMLAILVPLSWVPIVQVWGFDLTAAIVLSVAVLGYYFVLDVPLALAMAVVIAVLIALAEVIAGLGTAAGWTGFAALFIGGWILQLVGHAFEGRRPALVDNFFQIFVAPIFLVAEAFFALGYKPEVRRAVQQRASELSSSGRTASAAPSSASEPRRGRRHRARVRGSR